MDVGSGLALSMPNTYRFLLKAGNCKLVRFQISWRRQPAFPSPAAISTVDIASAIFGPPAHPSPAALGLGGLRETLTINGGFVDDE